MPVIFIETKINAPIDRCFDLARSIDLHQLSTARSGEKAIAGVTRGLIGNNQKVTWSARHFGIRQELSSVISQFLRPYYFRDEQTQGPFKYIVHDHKFKMVGDIVIMTDHFEYAAPYGIAGNFFSRMVLTRYLTKLLKARNEMIRDYAETDKWQTIPGLNNF